MSFAPSAQELNDHPLSKMVHKVVNAPVSRLLPQQDHTDGAVRLGRLLTPGTNVDTKTSSILHDLDEGLNRMKELALNKRPLSTVATANFLNNTLTMKQPVQAFGAPPYAEKSSTVNTSPAKMLAYKAKVIKGIVNRRMNDVIRINKNRFAYQDEKHVLEKIEQRKKFKSHAIDKDIKKSKYHDIYINNETDKDVLERYLKRFYKEKGLIDESIESSNFIGYDKFGRKRSRQMETLLEKMKRPRDLLHAQEGRLSLGEQKVYDLIKGLGPGGEPRRREAEGNDKFFEMDSLIDSAFNSIQNDYWEKYELSVNQRQVSECSEDEYDIYKEQQDDKSTGHDQFSDLNNSGSSLSSDYSDLNTSTQKGFGSPAGLDPDKDQTIYEDQIGKYCFFKIIQGLRLPMLMGEKEGRYQITDLIQISQDHMLAQRLRRNKKLSSNLIEKIFAIYLEELGAAPLDLMKGIQVGGHLVFNNYRLSCAQLNSIAVTIPYILNIRYINLENTGMRDQQAGYIIKACHGLSKLSQLYLGRNHIGRGFVKELSDRSLSGKLEEISLPDMSSSPIFVILAIEKFQLYENLKFLDISGNEISNEGAIILGKLVEATKHLEFLNLRGCMTRAFEPARKILFSLLYNNTIKHLNLSCNRFNHNDQEFGSRIGRLVQVNTILQHLDIQNCKLSKEEILFITLCLKHNGTLIAIHMGFNNIDLYGRILARSILNARVQHPFRAQIQIHDHIKTIEDKNIVLVLNSFIMSSMPPANLAPLESGLAVGPNRKPLKTIEDVQKGLQAFLSRNEQKADTTSPSDDPYVTEGDRSWVKAPQLSEPKAEKNGAASADEGEDEGHNCRPRRGGGKDPVGTRVDPANLPKSPEFKKGELSEQIMKSIRTNSKILQGQSLNADAADQQLAELQKALHIQVAKRQLQAYFNNEKCRKYDMLHFLDFYGQKFQSLQNQNKNSKENSAVSIVDDAYIFEQLKVKYQECAECFGLHPRKSTGPSMCFESRFTEQNSLPNKKDKASLIKTQIENALGEENKETTLSQKYWDVIADRREKKQLKDLEFLISSQGTIDPVQMKEIKTAYAWSTLFNELDVMVSEELLEANPSKHMSSDLVFYRILGEPSIQDGDQWRDSADCIMCKKYNHVQIERLMTDDDEEDKDFQEIMNISAVLNKEKLVMDPGRIVLETQDALMPVYEDVFESADESITVAKSRRAADPSSSGFGDASADEGDQQSAAILANKGPQASARIYAKECGIESPNVNPPQNFQAGSTLPTGGSKRPSRKLATGYSSNFYSVQGSIDASQPNDKLRQSGGSSVIIEKCPRKPPQPLVPATNYTFNKHHQGQSLLPLGKTRDFDNIKCAIEQNVVMYSSNICAAPVQIRDLQDQIQQVNDFEQQNIDSLNQFSSMYSQRQIQDGVVFRNITMREDLLEFEDSSDEEARIQKQKEMEDEINYKFDSVMVSPSGSIEAQVKQANATPIEHEALKSRPKTQQKGKSGRRSTKPQYGAGGEQAASQDNKRNNVQMTPALAMSAKSKENIKIIDNAGDQSNEEIQFSANVTHLDYANTRASSNLMQSNIRSSAQYPPRSTACSVNQSNEASETANEFGTVSRFSSRNEVVNPMVTNMTSITCPPQQIISEADAAKEATRRQGSPSRRAMEFPKICKSDFKNLKQIKKDVKKQGIQFNRDNSEAKREQMEEKIKQDQLAQHGQKHRYPKNALVAAPQSNKPGAQNSALEALSKELSYQWYQLKKTDQEEEKSMYLVASFNHWFPVKMRERLHAKRKATRPALSFMPKTDEPPQIAPDLEAKEMSKTAPPKKAFQTRSMYLQQKATQIIRKQTLRMVTRPTLNQLGSIDSASSLALSRGSRSSASFSSASSREGKKGKRRSKPDRTKSSKTNAMANPPAGSRARLQQSHDQAQRAPRDQETPSKSAQKQVGSPEPRDSPFRRSRPAGAKNKKPFQQNLFEKKLTQMKGIKSGLDHKLADILSPDQPAKQASRPPSQAEIPKPIQAVEREPDPYGDTPPRRPGDDIEAFVFSDYLPPGTHYFYFVKDGKYFCLSTKYPTATYPATNLQMNKIEVDQKEWTAASTERACH